MRWRMHKRTEQKEDGRRIYYYTFTPAEPSGNPMRLFEKTFRGGCPLLQVPPASEGNPKIVPPF
ncbi:MAG: hypothetical protein NZL85_10800 [Fimbriimonadales bacterium]|nr:hypothetical protein [Fimbriimonadales bacterium]